MSASLRHFVDLCPKLTVSLFAFTVHLPILMVADYIDIIMLSLILYFITIPKKNPSILGRKYDYEHRMYLNRNFITNLYSTIHYKKIFLTANIFHLQSRSRRTRSGSVRSTTFHWKVWNLRTWSTVSVRRQKLYTCWLTSNRQVRRLYLTSLAISLKVRANRIRRCKLHYRGMDASPCPEIVHGQQAVQWTFYSR